MQSYHSTGLLLCQRRCLRNRMTFSTEDNRLTASCCFSWDDRWRSGRRRHIRRVNSSTTMALRTHIAVSGKIARRWANPNMKACHLHRSARAEILASLSLLSLLIMDQNWVADQPLIIRPRKGTYRHQFRSTKLRTAAEPRPSSESKRKQSRHSRQRSQLTC